MAGSLLIHSNNRTDFQGLFGKYFKITKEMVKDSHYVDMNEPKYTSEKKIQNYQFQVHISLKNTGSRFENSALGPRM